MPLTVITISNVPTSLRGDLSKWMQEIATGVYIGNFNVRVREKLWERVKQNVRNGEATLSFAYRNEIGYQFETYNSQKVVINYEGIPFVLIPRNPNDVKKNDGFSTAAQIRKMRKYTSVQGETQLEKDKLNRPYVIIDIETDGLDISHNKIIEIAAIKVIGSKLYEFNQLINHNMKLPIKISKLTGITDQLLMSEGKPVRDVIVSFLNFINSFDLVGYNIEFDMSFINKELIRQKLPVLNNRSYDLREYVRKEKMHLDNYKLETVLLSFGINERVPHRALLDARLIHQLSTKVNGFIQDRDIE